MSTELETAVLYGSDGQAVRWEGGAIVADREPEIVISVVIDYAHLPDELWGDRIARAKRLGANTIEVVSSPGNGHDARSGFLAECGRQDMSVLARSEADRESADADLQTSNGEYAILRRCATGAGSYLPLTDFIGDALGSESFTSTETWRAVRRAALWAQTFRHILLHGKLRQNVTASKGLAVSEIATRENGSILFVDNPSATATIEGYVPPYLPEVTLGPGELFPYVHDAPIGPADAGGRYLASYVGLVKSDARVLAAHIRPDPLEGARVYVYGVPGETREVVLFHGAERGTATAVTFGDAPEVYPVGPSQIVALSTELAGRTFFSEDDFAPVLIGPDDVLDHGTEFATITVAPGQEHTIYSLAADGGVTTIDIVAPAADQNTDVAVRIAL